MTRYQTPILGKRNKMTTAEPTYRPKRIGHLDRKVTVYAPTYQRNVLGGQKPQWALWATVFAQAMKGGGDEKVLADKITAVKETKFRIRHFSAAGLNETMLVRFDGDDYNITHIEEDYTDKRNHFKIITAERRKENIMPVVLTGLAMGFSQTFSNITNTQITVTAGTLLDPNTDTADDFHQRLFIFRGGGNMVRAIYNDGYTVSGNVITFSEKLRGENVLVHQYTGT